MKLHRSLLFLAGMIAAFALAVSAQAPPLPPPPAATTVTPSGQTATTVTQAAGATQVATGTVSGGNGYNAFSAFQVAPGSTVDLLVPAAATNNNLLNLVSGSQTQIFGTVNSLLNNGAIGGNIFFADPQGIVIGTTGILNVGSLTLATPTANFVNNFFNDTTGNTATLLAGTEPLTSDGLIAVAGQVRSVGPTTMSAGTVDISGTVTTGASQFTNLVNTAGLQTGQAININGNTISIDGGLYGGATAASLNAGTDDVNLTASPSDTEALANAVAAISVNNASLSGNGINIKATASATSSDTLGSQLSSITDSTSFPFSVTGNVNIDTASANAAINLGGGTGSTSLHAAGNVTIAAEADTSTTIKTLAAVGDFSYGTTDATATANLASNASITAGGNVALGTLVNNTLALSPSAASAGTPSASVTFGKARSTSTTTLAGTVQAATIGITADNENSFSAAATTTSGSNGFAGVGVALGFYSSQANAVLSGTATASGADTTSNNMTTPALDVLATSNNSSDNVSSSSSVSSDSTATTVTNSASGGVPFLGDVAAYLGKFGQSKTSSESNSGKLALAAAVSYASSSNQANATVSGTGTAQLGSVGINSQATDKPQESAGGSASGSQLSVGGGVAIANFSNTANTTVSGTVSGDQGVSILAAATLPDPFDLSAFTNLPNEFNNFQFVAPSSITDGSAYQKDWNAAEKLGGDLANVLNPSNSNGIGQFLNSNLGLSNVVTSFVNTGASAEGGQGGGTSFGLAGSVNILGITNQATATVASGAIVDAANGGVGVNANANAFLINVAGLAADLGQLKDKNPGASGDAALGGSYNGVTLNNGATAAVNDGAQVTAENGGAINVAGDTAETLINVTQAGDNAGKFGVNGAFGWITLNNNAFGYIQSGATVAAGGDVNVGANNNLTDFTIGGALGFGGNAQVGATVDWNQFTDNTEAYIGDPNDQRTSNSGGSVTAGGNVNVDAIANETLWNISLAAEAATGQSQNDTGSANTSEGGGSTSTSEGTGSGGKGSGSESFGLGISGNVSINDITDNTRAFINNAAQVLAAGQIGLKATDTSFAVSGGLAAAIASGGDSGLALAGAFARNDFSKTTEATADNALLAGPLVGGQASKAGSISLDAESNGSLLTIAAGGGIAMGDGLGLAGSVNNNVLTNTTKAGLGNGAVAEAQGDITLNASQADRALSIAGALAYSGSFGLGAALDYSTYSNTTDAYIGDGANVSAGGNLKLTASTDEKLLPIAAALGVSDEVSLGGSVVKDQITNDTEATIGAATATAGDNLLLGADDSSQLLLVAGSLGGSGSAGIGLAGAISIQSQPLLDRTVKATIGGGATVSALGNTSDAISYQGQNVVGTLLDATAESGADTIVAGVGVAGDAGIAASLALNYITEDVEASIDSGASVNANNTNPTPSQSVGVNANDSSQILDVAGEIAGAGTAAIGAAADVQFLHRTVKADLGGTINASDNITATATLGGSDWSVAGAASLAGTVDLAGAASAIFDTTQVTADVLPSATIAAQGNVLLDAERTANLTTIDGELGFSAEVGVGGAVSLVEQQDTTTADVGNGATVTALGKHAALNTLVNLNGTATPGPVDGLAVIANANDNLLTIAAGGQVTTGVSVAGSVVLNDISETTQAYVDSNAVINPASSQNQAGGGQMVDILAHDGTTLTSGVGALAAGIDLYGVGIGAAVNLEGPVAQLPSAASSFSSSLTSNLNGSADAQASSVPGGFSKLTTAGVNDGATVNAKARLDIAALSSEDLTSYDGAVGAGIVGVAGSVELDDYTPTTTAYFGNCGGPSCADSTGATAKVGSANVQANDQFGYNAVVGEVSLGGVGLGASVLDAIVAANTSAFVGDNSDLTTATGAQIGSDFTDSFDAATLAGGVAAIAVNVPYASITDQSNNAAFIANSATVAGGNGGVELSATMRRTVAALSGAAQLGALGAGATILDVTFAGANHAAIGNGDTVTGNGNINLAANLYDTVPEYLPANFAQVPGIPANTIPTGVLGASVGGLAGIGGQVTLTDNAGDFAATGNSTLTAGNGINVQANDQPRLWASAGAAEAGLIGAGAAIADIYVGGQTGATLEGTDTATSGAIQVSSQLLENLTANATGIGAGVANGDGTVANINDTGSNAVTQAGTASAGGDAYFDASTARTANATSGSTSYGLLAVGISFADVNLGGSTTAAFNPGTVTAGTSNHNGTATLHAEVTDTANPSATVNAGGAGSGVGAMSGNPDGLNADPNLIDPTVETTVASGSKVNAATINILANDTSNLYPSANGGLTGALNVGLLDAEGKADPQLTLTMDGTLTGGAVTVQDGSHQTVVAGATSSESSSLASGYSTRDGADASPYIQLTLGGAVNASGNALVESDSNNTVSAAADATAGAFSLAAGGYTTSTANIFNNNLVTVSGTIASSGGNSALNAISDNNIIQNNATGGTGSGVLTGADTTANSTLTDNTHANLDGNLDALQGTASQLAQSTDNATSNALDQTSGFSGASYVEASSYTGVTADIVANVDGSANVQAAVYDLTATLPVMQSSSVANAIAEPGLHGDGTANSDFEGHLNPVVNVLNGASITAPAINILANVGNQIPLSFAVFGNSDATAGTHSASGSATANATNNAYLDPSANLDTGATLTTNNLKVQALYPLTPLFGSQPNVSGVSTVTWVATQVQEVVNEVVGWIPFIGNLINQVTKTVTQWVEQITDSTTNANSYGAFHPGSNINLNATIQQLGGAGSANLTIGPNGQVEPGAQGLSVQGQDSSNVLMSSLVNDSNPLTIFLQAQGGTIAGNPTIIAQDMPASVSITNDSNLNLILQQLSPIAGNNGQPALTTQADTVNLNPTFVENQTPTAITIANNGAGDVVFTNTIADQPGSLSVTNAGGDILGTVNSLLEVNQLALDAPHGSIGSAAGTSFACALCPFADNSGNLALGALNAQPDEVALAANAAPVAPTVSAVARGDIDLALTPYESVAGQVITAAPSVDLTNILAGGNANLTLNPAAVQGVELKTYTFTLGALQFTFTYPAPVNGPAGNTDYNVGAGQWLAAGGNLSLDANGSSGSQVTLNDNGLVASGFQNLAFVLGPNGAPSSLVSADGQNNASLLNYLQNFGGAPVLSNLDVSDGGHIAVTGSNGAVTGNGVLGVLNGLSGVQIANNDPHQSLMVQNLSDGGTVGSSIQVFGENQGLSGTLAGTGVSLANYGDPAGNINVSSQGGLQVAGVVNAPLGEVVLQAQQNLDATAGRIVAGTAANLSSQGDASLGPIEVLNGDLQALAGGNLFADGEITAARDASLRAGQSLAVQQLTAGANADLNAQQNLKVEALDAGGNATLAAGQDINAGSVVAGQAANLHAGGNINAQAVVALGGASLDAGAGINLATLQAGTDAELAAGQDIVYNLLRARGNATLLAGGNILGKGPLTAGQNATLTAQHGGIALQDLSAGQDANLSAEQDIAALLATAGRDANLTAGHDINLGTLAAGQGASLQAGGDINLAPGSISAGGDATLAAAGNINSQNGSIGAGQDAMLTAGHDILLGAVTAGQNATLQAGQDINLGTVAAVAGNADLTATVGSINIGAVTAGTDANLTAGTDVNGPSGTIAAGQDATLAAGNDINLGTVAAGNNALLTAGQSINFGTITAGTDATLTAGADVNGPNGTITAGQNATLQAGQDINLGTVAAVAGNADLTATAGSINFGTITAGTDANLTAGADLNGPNGTVTAGQDATLAAGNDINLGTVAAGNNATLTANDDININAAGSITAGNTASLTTLVNDINLLGTVTAPTALLTANRNISGGGTVKANVTQLAAETGAIGSTGDDINLELNTLNGVTPTLSVASRGDSNLNLTAVDPPDPNAGGNGGGLVDPQEPVGSGPTLYADIINLLVGGNVAMNLNPGVETLADGSTQAANAWYEIPAGDAAIAAGNINVNETGQNRDYSAVTLDVDGLLASGFQNLNYTIGPTGAWTTTVTDGGKTATGPVNFGTIANGVINLSNINANQGGVIRIAGTGQLANANNLWVLSGPSSVTIDNQDPNLLLQTNDIGLGYGLGEINIAHRTSTGGIVTIRDEQGGKQGGGQGEGDQGGDGHNWGDIGIGNDKGNGQETGGGMGNDGLGDGANDGAEHLPSLTLTSAAGINLAGQIANAGGVTQITAQGNITGGGLTLSRLLTLTSVGGGIGAPGAALAVGIGDADGDIDGLLNASAAGDIYLTAPASDLPLGTITTPGNIDLSTPAGSILNALGDPDSDHSRHDAPPPPNLSGNNITLNAGGSIGTDDLALTGIATGQWNLAAGTGIHLASAGDFNAGAVQTLAGEVNLRVDGNATLGQLSAPSAAVAVNRAGGSLSIGQAAIASELDASADNILIGLLTHTDAVQPLELALAGYRGGMAQSIIANVVSISPVLLEEYASQTGAVSVAGDWLDVDHARIGQSASFSNAWLRVALTNTDRRGQAESLNLDLVGNQQRTQGGELSSTVTTLQSGTFPLPATLTRVEQEMVRELGHDGGH